MVSLIRGNRGQSVIEFALVLPLLLIVLIGITQFGRAVMMKNIITSAAREGARLAVVTEPDVERVEDRVRAVCAAAGVTPTSITVSGPEIGDPNREVTVTVTSTFEFIKGAVIFDYYGGNATPGSIQLRATSVMRHETL